MNRKFLLAALSLPLVFAACSQDEFMDNSNRGFDMSKINAKGYKVALNVTRENGTGSDADTRAWNESGNKMAFTTSDRISVYWLGRGTEGADITNSSWGSVPESADNLKGQFNSIFKKKVDGETARMTSESMVFEGGNVVVYPGDVHFTSAGEILLKVDQNQTKTTFDNMPFISNQLFIADQFEGQTTQRPGYYGSGDDAMADLDAPTKQAANFLYLDLNIDNAKDLIDQFNFAVEKVEIMAGDDSNKPFATESNLQVINGAATYTGAVDKDEKIASIVAQTWSTPKTKVNSISTTYLEKMSYTNTSDLNVRAKFVLLPNDEESLALTGAKIVVYTSCGNITLTDVKTGEGEGAVTATPVRQIELNGENHMVNSDTDGEEPTNPTWTIAGAVMDWVTCGTATSTTFKNEKIGRAMARAIHVDASKVELDGCEVANDADINRYINMWEAMNSSDEAAKNPITLVMVKKENVTTADNLFPDLKAATAERLTALAGKISLVANKDLAGVQIVGGGEVFTVPYLTKTVPDGESYTAAESLALVLAADYTWTMKANFQLSESSESETSVCPLEEIINNGTLTITGGAFTRAIAEETVIEKLTNKGTININGTKVQFGTLVSSGIVNVKADSELQFADDIAAGNLTGTINVEKDGYITLLKDVTVVNSGTINNAGTVGSASGLKGLTNGGKLYVTNDDAVTYVQDNTYGEIYLKNRKDEVGTGEGNEGKIIYMYGTDPDVDNETLNKEAGDKFTVVVFGAENYTTPRLTLDENVENVTLVFKGTTRLTSYNNKSVADVAVEKGGKLEFYTGNEMTVNDLYVYGTIVVGGRITYTGTYTLSNRENEITVGNGSILKEGEQIVYSATELTSKLTDSNVQFVKLATDVTLSSGTTISTDKTIDLNGCTITASSSTFSVSEGNTLELKNGKIVGDYSSKIAAVEKNGTLVLENMTVTPPASGTGMSHGIYANAGDPEGSGDGTTVIIKHSNISVYGQAFATNANDANHNSSDFTPITVVVENSTLMGGTGVLVNVPSNITIKESELRGNLQGLLVRGGTVTCENCNIYKDNTVYPYYKTTKSDTWTTNWESGNMVSEGAIVMGDQEGSDAYNYPTTVNLTGCEVAVKDGSAADVIYATSNGENSVTFTYDGGTVITGTPKYEVGNAKMTVNGVEPTAGENN